LSLILFHVVSCSLSSLLSEKSSCAYSDNIEALRKRLAMLYAHEPRLVTPLPRSLSLVENCLATVAAHLHSHEFALTRLCDELLEKLVHRLVDEGLLTSPAVFDKLAACSNLSYFKITGAFISNSWLQTLLSVSRWSCSLISLDLSGNADFSDVSLLSSLSRLVQLDLSDNQKPLSGFSQLCSSLRILSLARCTATNVEQAIGLLPPALHSLNLAGCHLPKPDALAALSRFTALALLDLSYCGAVYPSFIASIAACRSIRTLDLRNSRLTQHPLPELASLTAVRHFNLSYCELDDESVEPLLGLVELQGLVLSGNLFSDVAGVQLSRLSSLAVLSLQHTAISAPTLAALGNLAQLASLNIRSCRGATEPAVHALRARLPTLEIDLSLSARFVVPLPSDGLRVSARPRVLVAEDGAVQVSVSAYVRAHENTFSGAHYCYGSGEARFRGGYSGRWGDGAGDVQEDGIRRGCHGQQLRLSCCLACKRRTC
jgi:Leucine-rich repeat (LRR) protein